MVVTSVHGSGTTSILTDYDPFHDRIVPSKQQREE